MDENPNRWSEIATTKDSAGLYIALNLSNRYNYKQLADHTAKLPSKLIFTAEIDYKEEKATAEVVYQPFRDEENGIFKLETTEVYGDSQVLLSSTKEVAKQGDKYILQGEKKSTNNEITAANLCWKQAIDMGYGKDSLVTLRLGDLSKEAKAKKLDDNVFNVEYSNDKWLIYLNSSYMFKAHYGRNTRIPKDYPNGDALCFEAVINTQEYILEHFMYQQLARRQFKPQNDIISKEAYEAFERRCLYQTLHYTVDGSKDDIVKKALESLQENNQTKDIVSAFSEIRKASDDLILSLPPSAIGKLLYLLINVDWSKADEQDGEDSARFLVFQAMQVAVKLLSTLNTKKAYLVALENYQPLTEYNKMNVQEAIDAIWHDENSILYFKDYGKNAKTAEEVFDASASYSYIYGVYKYLNSEEMELKDTEPYFAQHKYIKFPENIDYVNQRKAEPIEKQLKMGKTTLENGNPSTRIELPSKTIAIQPCYAGIYLVTGDITLGGDFTVKDTTSPLQQVELTAKKGTIQAKAKADLANALGTLSIEKALPEDANPIMNFSSKFGNYDISINKIKRNLDNSITVTGSISKEQSLIDKNIDGQEIKGNLSLDFKLILREMLKAEFAASYGAATKTVFAVGGAIVFVGVAIVATPIIVAVGGAIATGVGAVVVVASTGLATILEPQMT